MKAHPPRTIVALLGLVASSIVLACSSQALDSASENGPPAAPLASADAVEPAAVVASNTAPDASDAPDASIAMAAYTCDAPPEQCKLTCTPGACTLACSPDDATDCAWSCAAPDCACTDAPTAACVLHDPVAVCDVKCEKPECEIQCPVCTSEPCAACTTACKQPHCVTHCQAPKFIAASGGTRVTHCEAPKPSCATTPAAPTCTWGPATDGPGLSPSCERPSATTTCAQPSAPACDLVGCDEACSPLGACTQECAKPSCIRDPDTGLVACDPAPTSCVPTCSGGACHVTTCD